MTASYEGINIFSATCLFYFPFHIHERAALVFPSFSLLFRHIVKIIAIVYGMYAKFPIKYKLTSIIFIILIPLIGFCIHHYFEMIERSKAQIKSHNLEIASNIAKDLTVIIDGSFRILTTLAVHPAVQARDPEDCDRLSAILLP